MEAGAGLFGLLTRFTNDMMNDGHRDVIEDAMEIADKCVAPTPKFYWIRESECDFFFKYSICDRQQLMK